MASEHTSASPLGDEPNASRRGFIAAAATMAAAARFLTAHTERLRSAAAVNADSRLRVVSGFPK